ncbi:zf-HC2 domain-containing protein [Ornithinibacillus salinisoli]|uniref:Zf-HC2 domain-containing protein n=1 Tax=Ornithinibacillus salinisoli TaxID=1848459 RepID=A0ABW4W4E0_9BACI
MRKNCDMIRDLIPMYVENLTSEDSNQYIKEHLNSCEDCMNYLNNVERDLPNNDLLDVDTDINDQKLMKGIKRRINKMKFMAILIGVLVGVGVSLMFFNIALVSVVLLIGLLVFLVKTRKEVNFEKRGLNIVIFVLSFISLVISLKVFWNIAIYVDDFGASPVAVYGGDFWLYMAWLRLALLAIITFISGMKLFSK